MKFFSTVGYLRRSIWGNFIKRLLTHPNNHPRKQLLLLFSFHTRGNWGSASLSGLPRQQSQEADSKPSALPSLYRRISMQTPSSWRKSTCPTPTPTRQHRGLCSRVLYLPPQATRGPTQGKRQKASNSLSRSERCVSSFRTWPHVGLPFDTSSGDLGQVFHPSMSINQVIWETDKRHLSSWSPLQHIQLNPQATDM